MKQTSFTTVVKKENTSLKVYIPKPSSDYIGIMPGDTVEVKILKVRSPTGEKI